MRRTLISLCAGFAVACSASAPPPAVPAAPASLPTAPVAANPVIAQPAPTAPGQVRPPANAVEWRARGDELARGGDNAGAAKAYDSCALAAGSDMETSLYCQTAVAVLKKMRSRDGG